MAGPQRAPGGRHQQGGGRGVQGGRQGEEGGWGCVACAWWAGTGHLACTPNATHPQEREARRQRLKAEDASAYIGADHPIINTAAPGGAGAAGAPPHIEASGGGAPGAPPSSEAAGVVSASDKEPPVVPKVRPWFVADHREREGSAMHCLRGKVRLPLPSCCAGAVCGVPERVGERRGGDGRVERGGGQEGHGAQAQPLCHLPALFGGGAQVSTTWGPPFVFGGAAPRSTLHCSAA